MEAAAVPRAGALPGFTAASPRSLSGCSDERLVALVRAGWPGAFEALYDRHHRGIVSFCRHLLADPHEAEDATQQVFLAAYNDLLASSKPILLRPWLFKIARNRCYSIVRSRREQPAAELHEISTDGLAAQVQRREELRDLVGDLQRLPLEQRAALVLAELDALSHREIAEALGVPTPKVKALVFQARQSLTATRAARETTCREIRAELSVAQGAALRRGHLRRHLRVCAGCRQYRRDLERQRRHLAIVLPVVPSLALKQTVLAGTVGVGAAAGIAGAGWLAAGALKSGFFKGLLAVLLAGAGTAGTLVASEQFAGAPLLSSVAHNLLAGNPGSAHGPGGVAIPSGWISSPGRLRSPFSPLSPMPGARAVNWLGSPGTALGVQQARTGAFAGAGSGSAPARQGRTGARSPAGKTASRTPAAGGMSPERVGFGARPAGGSTSLQGSPAGGAPAPRRLGAPAAAPGSGSGQGTAGGPGGRPGSGGPGGQPGSGGPGGDSGSAGPGGGGNPGSAGPNPGQPGGGAGGSGSGQPGGVAGGPGGGTGAPGAGAGGPGGRPGAGSGAGPGGGAGGPDARTGDPGGGAGGHRSSAAGSGQSATWR
jgi:RNA polymerase sigma factor (sigma-70 family)